MMTVLRALLTFALLALAPLAHAQEFPKLSGRVVDAANLLDPAQEQALTAKLEALDKQSGRQLVVATIPDLNGQEIGDYSYRLGRAWGIGDKAKNDGTLLVVAPNERKVWIATGYGVEGIVTDALASRIYRNAIIPRFKEGDFPGGIDAGVDAISTLLTLPPDQAKAQAAAAAREERENDRGDHGFMAIVWVVVLLFFVLPMIFGRGNGRRYRSGAGPVILWGPTLGGGGWGGGGGSGWGGGDGGGFSGGGGGFGGGGAGGSW